MKGAAIAIAEVQHTDRSEMIALIDVLKDLESDDDCVCSWFHSPTKHTITYTVVGPQAKVEAFKQAAMAVAKP